MNTRLDALLRCASVVGLVLTLASCGLRDDPRFAAPSPPTPDASSAGPSQSTASAASNDASAPEPESAPLPAVVVITVDGLNPDALAEVGWDRLPAFSQLVEEGASTLNARSAVEATVTLPNHSSVLTGRRISGPDGTSLTFNENRGGTLAKLHGTYVPGIFDVAHDHGLSTGLYAEKLKFSFLVRSWNEDHGAPDVTDADDGRDKLDVDLIAPADQLVPALLSSLANRTSQLSFLHVAAPDAAGHAHGFMSPDYLDAVVAADRELGGVLDFVAERSRLRQQVTIIVTADHGGIGSGHSALREPSNYTIPFFVWGPGVRQGADLYTLNPDRLDPGTSRPDYRGAQPIRNRDAASLALSILGLPMLASTTEPLRLN